VVTTSAGQDSAAKDQAGQAQAGTQGRLHRARVRHVELGLHGYSRPLPGLPSHRCPVRVVPGATVITNPHIANAPTLTDGLGQPVFEADCLFAAKRLEVAGARVVLEGADNSFWALRDAIGRRMNLY